MDEHTSQHTASQTNLPSFLVGSIECKERLGKGCQHARTLHGFSPPLDRWCVIALPCKRWGCRHCGERKIVRFGWRCADAKPNRLVTLTIANALWETPRDAYDGTKSKVSEFAVRLRREHGEFEYFKVLEVTKKGWPHYHLIVRCPYIDQKEMSNLWATLTGAPIVDVRAIKKTADVYYYVVKYLGKQKYIPWTDRRVSWSKNFWQDADWKAPPKIELVETTVLDEHPDVILRKYYHPFRIQIYSDACWCVDANQGSRIERDHEY